MPKPFPVGNHSLSHPDFTTLSDEAARGEVTSAADAIRGQIAASVRAGARPAIDESEFPASRPGTPYLAPQLLLNADHSMPVMKEEIFGPVAGLMKVSSDEQAIALRDAMRVLFPEAVALVSAARQGDSDAAAALEQPVLQNRPPDAIGNRHVFPGERRMVAVQGLEPRTLRI